MNKEEQGEKRTMRERGKEGVKGFLEFIKGQGVIGFAVGLVLGTAASGLVNSLINNVVMPPLGFLLGSSDGLKGLSWDMGTTASGERAVLSYGVFLSDLINFLIIALVVYLVVKWLKVELKKK
jgi:large conductance mechanosensitive channel